MFQQAYLAAEQALDRKLIPLEQMEASAPSPNGARQDSDASYPQAQCSHRLVRHKFNDAELEREVRPHVATLLRWMEMFDPDLRQEEDLLRGSHLSGRRLLKHLSYGEVRLFRARRAAQHQTQESIQLRVLLDTSASMYNEGKLDHACRLTCLLCFVLKQWPHIEGQVFAFNDLLIDCGNIRQPALAGLAPTNGTNDAGALEFLLNTFEKNKRGAVLVLSDGGSTLCSQSASRELIESRPGLPRILYGAVGSELHPGFDHQVDLQGPIAPGLLKSFGEGLSWLLRG